MDEVTVKGFITGNVLELVADSIPEEDFAKLEEELGVRYKSVKLSYFKDYPVEIQIRAEEKVAEILWNRSDDGVFYEFGRRSYESFATSAVGKMGLTLVGNDPKRIVKASIRLMSHVMKGVDIEVGDLGPTEMSFRFRNNPYRPLGWKGVIDATLEAAGVDPKVKIVKHGPKDHEFLVSWD